MSEEPHTYRKVFRLHTNYLDKRALVKMTKDIWTTYKDNRTKYKVLDDLNRWHELEAIGVEGQLAAHLWDKYWILTNGIVLNGNFNASTPGGQIELRRDGQMRLYYVSDLLYYGFIDRSYDPLARKTKFSDFKSKQPTLETVMLQANYIQEREKAAAEETEPSNLRQGTSATLLSPQIFDPLMNWEPLKEDY